MAYYAHDNLTSTGTMKAVHAVEMQGMREETHEDIDQLVVRSRPGAWFETEGHIIDKAAVERGARSEDGVALHANWLQKRLFEIAQWCLDNNEPCRLLVYKPRQKGCSTGTMALAYWWSRRQRSNCLLMGGQYSQVENLWGIFSHYASKDRFEWGNSIEKLNTDSATFSNGSEWQWETARDPEAGRSGTYQVAVLTEVARWAEQGVANASKVLNGVQNCVPKIPGTLVIMETTVKGGFGEFYHKWVGDKDKNVPGAVSFEDFKRGKRGNGWIKVFAPWFVFEDSRIACRDEQEAADIMAGIGAISEEEKSAEQEMIRRFRLGPEQIKYWRDVLINECQRDPDNRDREYPPTPEAGFKSTLPGRFNRIGLRKLREGAEQQRDAMRRIILENPSGDRKNYVPRIVREDSEASYYIWEPPKVGYRYLLAADLAAGEEVTEGGDRDCQTVLVIRQGFMSAQRGCWMPPKVVATIKPNCRVDQLVLADMAWRLARYYGGCLIVPEVNYDKGFIRALRDRGAHLYERERAATDKEDQKPTKKFGFLTRGTDGEGMRGWCIERLAAAIREWDVQGSGIDCPAEFILAELENFIRTESGREEAAPGKHDDWVLALCIALATIDGATLYRAEVTRNAEPAYREKQRQRELAAKRGQRGMR
jgi:hypothetical protein